MTTPQSLIAERQRTHGDFEQQAEFSQYLKGLMRERLDTDRATLPMREAMEMICLSMSAIAMGDCTKVAHWRDIAMHAQLAVNMLERAQEANEPVRLPPVFGIEPLPEAAE